MKTGKIVIAIIVVPLAICTVCSAITGKDVAWKTSKSGNKYITEFYSHGKKACEVRTDRKMKVRILSDVENISARYNNYILVEKVKGICLNRKGDGKDEKGFYISYSKVKNHRKGKRYTTYLIYENSKGEDDITGRIDIEK